MVPGRVRGNWCSQRNTESCCSQIYFCLLLWIIFGSFLGKPLNFLIFVMFYHLLMFKLSETGGWWRFWRRCPLCSELCTLTRALHHSESCSFQYLCANLEWKGCKLERGEFQPWQNNFSTPFGATLTRLSHILCFLCWGCLWGQTKHPKTPPCFHTTVDVWIPDRYSGMLKASRQLDSTSVTSQNCSSLDWSAVLKCSTLPLRLWPNPFLLPWNLNLCPH